MTQRIGKEHMSIQLIGINGEGMYLDVSNVTLMPQWAQLFPVKTIKEFQNFINPTFIFHY